MSEITEPIETSKITKAYTDQPRRDYSTYVEYGKECHHRYLKTFKMSKSEFLKRNPTARSWFKYGKPGSKRNMLKWIRLMCLDLKEYRKYLSIEKAQEFSIWCDNIYIRACQLKKRDLNLLIHELKHSVQSFKARLTLMRCKKCKHFLGREHLSRIDQHIFVGAIGTEQYIGCCNQYNNLHGIAGAAPRLIHDSEQHICFEKKD